MNLVELAAIITGTTGLIAGLFSGYRSYLAAKNSARAAADAAMVNNFQGLYDELKEEVKRVKQEQTEERKQWAEERKELQSQIRELTKSNTDKDVTIAELRGELKGLTVKVDSQQKEAV